MPQLFVHLTVIREIVDDERLEPSAVEALRRRAALASFGAVLPDLPLFAGVRWRALLNLLGMVQPTARWHARLHHEEPMAVALALASPHARARLGPLSRLALVSGYLTHAALDSALHPLVNALIDAEGVSAPRARRALHARIEKVQSVCFHRHLYGLPADSDPSYIGAAELSEEVLAQHVLLHVTSALRQVYRTAPRVEELRRWVQGLAWYRHALRGRLEKVEGKAVEIEALRSRYFDEPRFLSQLEAAGDRAVAWINRAARAFAPGDLLPAARSELRKALPEVDLDQGHDPFAEADWSPDFHRSDADANPAANHPRHPIGVEGEQGGGYHNN